MPHEIEFDENGARFAYAQGTNPWHGLGTPVESAMSAADAIATARLGGWNLALEPMYIQDADRKVWRKVNSGFRAVYRHADGKSLGVVKDGYEILSNEETFAFADAIAGEGGYHYLTAGSLKGGSLVFMTLEAPSETKLPNGDVISSYLTVANSHDGSMALNAVDSSIVAVCANTVAMALNGASSTFRIRHTSNMADRIAQARKLLAAERNRTAAREAAMVALLDRKVSETDFADFLTKLVPITPDIEDAGGRALTNAARKRELIRDIYETSTTEDNKRGTAWGVLNAVTYYTNHIQTRKNTDSATAQENRMLALVWGDAADLGNRALALLS